MYTMYGSKNALFTLTLVHILFEESLPPVQMLLVYKRYNFFPFSLCVSKVQLEPLNS